MISARRSMDGWDLKDQGHVLCSNATQRSSIIDGGDGIDQHILSLSLSTFSVWRGERRRTAAFLSHSLWTLLKPYRSPFSDDRIEQFLESIRDGTLQELEAGEEQPPKRRQGMDCPGDHRRRRAHPRRGHPPTEAHVEGRAAPCRVLRRLRRAVRDGPLPPAASPCRSPPPRRPQVRRKRQVGRLSYLSVSINSSFCFPAT